MKGDPEILDILNNLLTHELTAINQYFIHHKMLLDWGYKKLSDKKRAESIEEMQHADEVIDRILFFDGVPNMQRLNPVKVGEDPVEQHKLDLELELEAVANLKKGIEICLKKADVGTRALLEKILVDEEEAIDWLETQLHLVDELGKSAYLAEHLE
jgi:bacterioferritin